MQGERPDPIGLPSVDGIGEDVEERQDPRHAPLGAVQPGGKTPAAEAQADRADSRCLPGK